MRRILPIIFILFLLSALFNQAFTQDKRLKTPDKTLKTLIKAIKTQDLELYKVCFFPKTLESEGQYSKLQENSGEWEELQGIFNGPQKLINGNYLTKDGIRRYKATVRAPRAEGGGIGTINFVKHEGNWVVWKW